MVRPILFGDLFVRPEQYYEAPESHGITIDPGPGFTGRVYEPDMYIDRERETQGPLPLPFRERYYLENPPENRTIHPRLEREEPIRYIPTADRGGGIIQPGNIDLANRPVLRNPDGSISTIETISIGTDAGHVLIPTIINGSRVSREDAIRHFQRTGEHLGIFDTPENATAFARALSVRQGQMHERAPNVDPTEFTELRQPPPAPPAPIQPPSIEDIEFRDLQLGGSGFRDVITETTPDGVVRLRPNVAQPFTLNERMAIEEYMNVFGSGAERGPRVREQGRVSTGARHYQPYGELIGPGDERMPVGETRPWVLMPDGTRQDTLPPGVAIEPSTNRIYAARDPREPYIRGRSEAFNVARGLGAAFLVDPAIDLGRAMERVERGLVAPPSEEMREAINIIGAVTASAVPGARGRAAREGARGAAEAVEAPRPRTEPPLRTPSVEAPPPRNEPSSRTPPATEAPPLAAREPRPGARDQITVTLGPNRRESRDKLFDYELVGPENKPIGYIRGTVYGDEANIRFFGVYPEHIPPGRMAENVLSIGNIRGLREAFRRDFPNVTSFSGYRTTGARSGSRSADTRVIGIGGGSLPGGRRPPRAIVEMDEPNMLGQINGVIRAPGTRGREVGNFYARTVRRSQDDPGFTQVGRIEIADEAFHRRGIYTAISDHIEATTGRPHVPDHTLTDAAYNWWLRRDPEAVRGLYNRRSDDLWERRPMVPHIVETARTRAVRDAFNRGELRSPLVAESTQVRRGGFHRRRFRLASNPDEPGAAAAASIVGRRRRRELQPKEKDAAGFYIHSLEIARDILPRSGTAKNMRRRLIKHGVSEGELRALGLDDILLGPRAVARHAWEDAYNTHSRLAREYGEDVVLSRRHPDNPIYRDRVERGAQSLARSSRNLEGLRNELVSAERAHLVDHVRRFREAEREVKLAYDTVRDARARRNNYSVEQALGYRAEALRELKAARENLRAAREGGDPTSQRRVYAQQLVDRIRANRPELETYVRSVPTKEQEWGPYAEGIRRIYEGNDLFDGLLAAGVSVSDAARITGRVREITDPINWRNRIVEMSSRTVNPHVVQNVMENIIGAPLLDVSNRITNSRRHNPRTPRYPYAVPDRSNRTMREQAVVMRRPGGGGLTPRMESVHWPRDLNIVGHMQTTVQRAPQTVSRSDVRRTAAINNRLDELGNRRRALEDTSLESSPANSREYLRIVDEISALAKERSEIRPRAGDDLIFMGNQFQSDAPRGVHPLAGRDPRSWLRPVLELFVDQGIGSGARYIGIPSSETVKRWNTIGPRTARFYDETLRQELDFILRRRGIRPISRRTIDRMYSPDATGSDVGFEGTWHLIELPRGLESGRGVRLYSRGVPVVAGGQSGQE